MVEVVLLTLFGVVFIGILAWSFRISPAARARQEALREAERLHQEKLAKLAKRKAALERTEREMPDWVKERRERARQRALTKPSPQTKK